MGVPGLPTNQSAGMCFDGLCRATVCVDNAVTVLDHVLGTPLNYSKACGADVCTFNGIGAYCAPKQAAGTACVADNVCTSGSCVMGTCAP